VQWLQTDVTLIIKPPQKSPNNIAIVYKIVPAT